MSSTFAVISDLHANLAAVQAVLDDIESQGVDEVICLGDVVGYGPQPIEVLNLVKDRASVTLLGNHDEALMGDAFNFSRQASHVVNWTREQMPREEPEYQPLWSYLADMQLMWERGPDMFVHGSPLDPTQEYLLPTDDLSSDKYDDVFDEFERFLFVGHTHLPCVITPDRTVRTSSELENSYALDAEQAIINVGSVGQPRDRDTRACYVIVDDTTVRWRRVEYDVETTLKQILAVGLPDTLAKRLKAGR
jgi:diadenosine tetraphosphatase ApaH/serine/threonine PP2A family protein phosphatase